MPFYGRKSLTRSRRWLRSLTPSQTGGVTGFVDQIDAYDRLSDDLTLATRESVTTGVRGLSAAQRQTLG